MAIINPFDFDPAGSLDRLHAYFMVTWMRINYCGPGDLYRNQIYELIGTDAGNVHTLEGLPRVDVVVIPGTGSVVQIRGTITNFPELVEEILFSNLEGFEPWTGQVSRYFASVANQVWPFIEDNKTDPFMTMGHSLGGAIAGLISQFGATRVFSAGAPREGNQDYANSRNNGIYLRLTNPNDVVPKVPIWFGAGPRGQHGVVMLYQLLVENDVYWHWGTRIQLAPDGSSSRPTEAGVWNFELGEYLIEAIRTGNWGTDHETGEYARRLRAGIPVPFPAPNVDLDFPGLQTLDAINLDVNNEEGTVWEVSTDPLEVALLRAFLLRSVNPTAAADPNPREGYSYPCS